MRLFRKSPRARTCPPADLPGGARPLVRLEGASKEAIETGRNRLVIAGTLFALVFVILAGRLVHLTLFQSGGEPSLAHHAASAERAFVSDRMPIVDRNGVLLATNLRTASLYADPRRVLDPAEAADRLIRALPELSRAELLAKLTAPRSFVWIKRNLTPRQQYEVNRLGVPGLQFHAEQRRVYPQGGLVAHVLGFTDVDNRGIAGIEQFFDDTLSDPARAGERLQLSIDVRVQHAVRDELQRSIAQFSALGGGGLVLDVTNGEIIALVSLPDFDPTTAGDASKNARFNRITLGVYEMGSTMKTLTTAMALDSGVVTLNGGYDASHPIRVARFSIRDHKPKSRWLSVPEIYMYSSNIGSAKMALDVGPAGQREFLGTLGLLRRPSVEVPEVGAPLLPHQWKQLETMTIGFGHGLSVSPLQLASATAAIINGGVLVPATLVKRKESAPPVGVQVVKASTSNTMRRLMHLVVDEGTGRKASVAGYLVGGKTGTSEKVNERGGYSHKDLLTSFVGAFPMHAPRYVVVAILDEPKGTKETFGFATAGWNVAPTVGRIIARIAPTLGVNPVDEESPEIQNAMAIAIPSQPPERKLAAY